MGSVPLFLLEREVVPVPMPSIHIFFFPYMAVWQDGLISQDRKEIQQMYVKGWGILACTLSPLQAKRKKTPTS